MPISTTAEQTVVFYLLDETRAGIEDLNDLEIVSTQRINDLHMQPFKHFGADVTED